VHFTFFPVGQSQLESFSARPAATRQAWKRALAEGHVVGNHTYDHKLLGTMSSAGIRNELHGQFTAMNRVLGFTHRELLMRPPGGSGGFNIPALHGQFIHTLSAVKERGYYMTMWTVDSNAPDGEIVTPHEDERFLYKIFHDPVEHVRNGSIILVHPTTLSINGMSRLVTELKARQYNLVSVPELFEPPRNKGK
jgi:peptidoglycan/xylan/chitin deacetylase (PgdA/CDA1 family)